MATPEQARLARLELKERRQLEAVGVRETTRISRQLQVQVLRGFRRGQRNFSQDVAATMAELEPVLRDGMVASHLSGEVRGVRNATPAVRERQARQLGVYDKATEFAATKLAFTEAQVAAVSKKYGVQAATITGQAGTQLEAALQVAMVQIIEAGESVQVGQAILREAMTQVTGQQGSAHLAETLYRTNVNMAYSAGRWEVAQDPDINSILWGFEYFAIDDDRVRPGHLDLNGMQLAKNDPDWGFLWPPNGFNCSCTTIELFVEPTKVQAKPPGAQADKDFNFNGGQVFGGAAPVQVAKVI